MILNIVLGKWIVWCILLERIHGWLWIWRGFIDGTCCGGSIRNFMLNNTFYSVQLMFLTCIFIIGLLITIELSKKSGEGLEIGLRPDKTRACFQTAVSKGLAQLIPMVFFDPIKRFFGIKGIFGVTNFTCLITKYLRINKSE